MCMLAMALQQAAGPTTRPTRLRPASEAADRDIADDESLDRETRIGARERLGLTTEADADLTSTTDEEIQGGQQKNFERGHGSLVGADTEAISARQNSLQKLFPSSTPARLGIPSFSGKGIPSFSGKGIPSFSGRGIPGFGGRKKKVGNKARL